MQRQEAIENKRKKKERKEKTRDEAEAAAKTMPKKIIVKNKKSWLSEVGFEPTPTYVDQKPLICIDCRRLITLSLAP